MGKKSKAKRRPQGRSQPPTTQSGSSNDTSTAQSSSPIPTRPAAPRSVEAPPLPIGQSVDVGQPRQAGKEPCKPAAAEPEPVSTAAPAIDPQAVKLPQFHGDGRVAGKVFVDLFLRRYPLLDDDVHHPNFDAWQGLRDCLHYRAALWYAVHGGEHTGLPLDYMMEYLEYMFPADAEQPSIATLRGAGYIDSFICMTVSQCGGEVAQYARRFRLAVKRCQQSAEEFRRAHASEYVDSIYHVVQFWFMRSDAETEILWFFCGLDKPIRKRLERHFPSSLTRENFLKPFPKGCPWSTLEAVVWYAEEAERELGAFRVLRVMGGIAKRLDSTNRVARQRAAALNDPGLKDALDKLKGEHVELDECLEQLMSLIMPRDRPEKSKR